MNQEIRRPIFDEELAVGRKPTAVEILEFLEQYRVKTSEFGLLLRSEEIKLLRECIER